MGSQQALGQWGRGHTVLALDVPWLRVLFRLHCSLRGRALRRRPLHRPMYIRG